MTEGTLPPRVADKAAIAWSYAMTIGRFLTTAVVTLILARLLGPAAFGVVAIALIFVSLFQTVLQNGLVAALVQRPKLDDAHLIAGFWIMMGGGALFALGTAIVGPLWGAFIDEPLLGPVCIALAPMLIFQAFTVVPDAMLRRGHRFRLLAICSLSAAFVGGVTGILLAVAGAGVWALVAQQLITALVTAVLLAVVTRWWPNRLPSRWAVNDLRAFSMRAAAGGAGFLVAFRAAELLISRFFGAAAVGIYRLARRLTDLALDVGVAGLQAVTLSDISRLQDHPEQVIRRYTTLQHTAAIVAIPGLGILAGTADPLVRLLGPEWEGTQPALRVLCIAALGYVFSMLLGPTLEALGRPGLLATVTWVQAVIGVAALVVVGRAYSDAAGGEQVLAIAVTTMAIDLARGAMLLYVTFTYVLKSSVLGLLRPLLPSLVAGVAGYGIPIVLSRGLGEHAAIVDVLLYGSLATVAAGTVLLLTDAKARQYLSSGITRIRNGPAAQPVKVEV